MDPLLLKLYNPNAYKTLFRVAVHWGTLPKGTLLTVGIGDPAGVKIPPNKKRPETALPSSIRDSCGALIDLAHFAKYQLSAGKDRVTTLPEILITKEHPAFLVLSAQLPQGQIDAVPCRFDVVQLEGRRVVGGCTVVINGALTQEAANG